MVVPSLWFELICRSSVKRAGEAAGGRGRVRERDVGSRSLTTVSTSAPPSGALLVTWAQSSSMVRRAVSGGWCHQVPLAPDWELGDRLRCLATSLAGASRG